jgi:hypothetical protein
LLFPGLDAEIVIGNDLLDLLIDNTGQQIFVRQVKITFLNKFLRAEPKSVVRFLNILRYDQINSPKQLKNVIFSGLFSKNRVLLLKSIDRCQL